MVVIWRRISYILAVIYTIELTFIVSVSTQTVFLVVIIMPGHSLHSHDTLDMLSSSLVVCWGGRALRGT